MPENQTIRNGVRSSWTPYDPDSIAPWNLKRVVHKPVKFPGNPVMVPDTRGEYSCYEAHVHLDEETRRLFDAEVCTRCGACRQVCPTAAVVAI